MQRNLKKKGKAMARPIKETPILFGEDARRFEERMKQVRRETPEERERRLANYELALKMLELGERTASLQAPFSSYIIRKLGPEEKVKSFDCGDADLNDIAD